MIVKELITKVPWKQVAKVGGYVAVAAISVVKSISDDKEKAEYEALKEKVSALEKLNSKDN